MEVYVECGSTAMAEDSATTNYSRRRIRLRPIPMRRIRRRRITRGLGDGDFARPIWRRHWRNSSASPQCSNPASRRFNVKKMQLLLKVKTSVPDPWHFETDPDSWICTLDYRSVPWSGSGSWSGSCSFVRGFQETTNYKFFKQFFCFLLTVL